METKHIKINVDYKKIKVFSEYNVDKLNYPLIVSTSETRTNQKSPSTRVGGSDCRQKAPIK